MLLTILKLKSLPKELDATDGIAVAICHFFQNSHVAKNSYKGWKDFINKNPKRTK